MQSFVPDIRLPSETPRDAKSHEQLGGLPWGLPRERWPKCSTCGKSQSLIAQFEHHPERLDLNGEGRMLYVFQCYNTASACSPHEPGSGANACFVLDPSGLYGGPTANPEDGPFVADEVRIINWFERDDGLTDAQVTAILAVGDGGELSDDVSDRITQITRLGSVPYLLQGPRGIPRDGWRFVGQIDCYYSFFSPPKSPPTGIMRDPKSYLGRTHCLMGANFGDCGMGYIYLRETSPIPEGLFFSQGG